MITFCPKCYHSLEEPNDDHSIEDDGGRLCPACQWFGDKSEVCIQPPKPSQLELAFLQLVAMYRDVCRLELLAEQLRESYPEYQQRLDFIKSRVEHAKHSLLYLFRGTRT
jgi:hypothetical protein